MAEVTVLPQQGERGRAIALFLMIIAPFVFGALAVALGQDMNWDLRNYHWYNAYAFLNGRDGFDLIPSQTPYFYSPALDIPFYLLATHVPAAIAGYALGFTQGLNFILLFMLAYAALAVSNPTQKVAVCALLAALGMLGGGGIALIGATFYDNITSLGLFASALLVVRNFGRLVRVGAPRAFLLALLCGLPAGLMMGLKLPAAIFAVGFCFGILGAGGPFRRLFLLSFAFGLGVLLGFAAAYGPWAWFLDAHYGSPFFPYFNDFFKAPLAPLSSARDTQFIPHGFWRNLEFPFLFTAYPKLVGEILWRDLRIPVLYVLLPAAVALRLLFGRNRAQQDALVAPSAARYLLTAAAVSYLVWLRMFAVYRYAIPLEMQAPLLIVLAVGLLPLKLRARALTASFILLACILSLQPGSWGRRAHWLDHFVEAQIPPLPEQTDLMILMAGYEPYSHAVTQFPPGIPFVRIQSNFASPGENKGINAVIRDRVAAHKGPFMLLMPSWQLDLGRQALRSFGLGLAPDACQKVIDRLYDDAELSLCKIVHTSTSHAEHRRSHPLL